MKRLFLAVILFLVLGPPIGAATLADILAKFNSALAELDSAEAYLPDTSKKIFINMAQQKICNVSGVYQKYTQIAFSRTASRYALPVDFNSIKGLMLKSKGQWYTIFDDPLFRLSDSSRMRYSISWKNKDSAEINLAFGDLVEDQTDIIYSLTARQYSLPNDFRRPLGAMLWTQEQWITIEPNLYFMVDKATPTYFTTIDDSISGYLYFKSTGAIDGDTIRLFYFRTATTGDSVRVLYYGRAPLLSADTSTSVVPENLIPYVVDEAVNYYLRALRAFNQSGAVFEQSRIDLGTYPVKEYLEQRR